MILIYKVESCEINLSIYPSGVWPQKTGGNTEASITVAWCKTTPPEGCTVNLEVAPVDNSGGHNHDGSIPKGTLSMPSITIPGGITAGSVSAGIYRSSEVSGEEKIVARVNGEKKGEAMIRVRVPGFLELGEGDGYTLIGHTSTHPQNHFGTENSLFTLLDIADAYYAGGKGTLRINDISLIWGGLFDYEVANTPWRPPHRSHRTGRNVDVDDVTNEEKSVTKSQLDKLIKEQGLNITVLDEKNHLHLTFL